MRSERKTRNKVLEDVFDKELSHFRRALYKWRINKRRESKIIEALDRYIDELNKVRKYACPLSVAILLSAIMEGVLFLRVGDEHEKASTTRTWQKNVAKGEEGISNLSLTQLIQIADELLWLRSLGRQALVIQLQINFLRKEFPDLSNWKDPELPKWDAKLNSDTMHNLRKFRNRIHPNELGQASLKRDGDDFVEVLWEGLRLLVLLEYLIGVEPALAELVVKDSKLD
jgi:hypothetical protein